MQTDATPRTPEVRAIEPAELRVPTAGPKTAHAQPRETGPATPARHPFGDRMASARRTAVLQMAQDAPNPPESERATHGPPATTRSITARSRAGVSGPDASVPGTGFGSASASAPDLLPVPDPTDRPACGRHDLPATDVPGSDGPAPPAAALPVSELPALPAAALPASDQGPAATQPAVLPATAALPIPIEPDTVEPAAPPAGPVRAAAVLPRTSAALPTAAAPGDAPDGARATLAGTDDAGPASTRWESRVDSRPPTSADHFAARLAQNVAAGWSQALPGAVAAPAAAAPGPSAPAGPMGHVATPITHPGFPAGFAGETASLVLAGLEVAEIRVHPPDMGPVRIEVSLNGEAARLAFSATQPETRQAIEQSLPLLKTMLAEHGLLLSDASVSQGRPDTRDPAGGTGQAGAGRDPTRHGDRDSGSDATPERDPPRPHRITRGLLDLYA